MVAWIEMKRRIEQLVANSSCATPSIRVINYVDGFEIFCLHPNANNEQNRWLKWINSAERSSLTLKINFLQIMIVVTFLRRLISCLLLTNLKHWSHDPIFVCLFFNFAIVWVLSCSTVHFFLLTILSIDFELKTLCVCFSSNVDFVRKCHRFIYRGMNK